MGYCKPETRDFWDNREARALLFQKGMNTHPTTSLWQSDFPPLHFAPLAEDVRVAVCVIGAGIAGLTTALFLARAGKKVVVVERGGIGSGETGRTTAHLASALDDRYFRIERLHGATGARIAAESHSFAVDEIERIAWEERIDCDLVRLPGHLFLGEGDSAKLLEKEYASARRAGLSVEWLAESPVPSFAKGPWIRFERQGQLHALKYLRGLAETLRRLGVPVHTDTAVTEVRSGEPVVARTESGHRIEADILVCATNTPFLDRFAMHTKQSAYRSYVIAIESPRGGLPFGLYWDTESPYHYVRYAGSVNESGFLVVGGEDHKTGQPGSGGPEPWHALEGWARARIPGLGAVRHRWSGQVEEPEDYLGYAGKNPGRPENEFIITGDSGNGMTHGTLGARIVSDLALGMTNPWAGLYSPSRITMRSAPEFVRENGNAFLQYRDHLLPRGHHPENLGPGQGAVLRAGLRPVAVYCDEARRLHSCSAICPHLGAVLRWNSEERTWDCPAHGSRFDADGRVLNGPANHPLAKADIAPAMDRS